MLEIGKAATVLAAALALSACGAARPQVKIEPDASMSRYHRVGVLPFSDPGGRGHAFAEAMSTGLFRMGFDPVNVNQLETVFRGLRMDPDSGLSIQDLHELKRLTYADALFFGTVDSGRKEVQLLMLDGSTGEVVLRARYRPGGPLQERPEQVSEQLLTALGRQL